MRVLDEEDKQVDVMDIKDAIALAKKKSLDLVEIAPKANPPVVKTVDFGKFKYQQEKKKKKAKVKTPEVKEVRFSPFIGDADFETRLKRVQRFLKQGNKVRIVVKFKGRQMGSKQFGYDVHGKVLDTVRDKVVIDMEPKFLGRHLSMVISPTYKKPSASEMKEKKDDKAKD